MPNGASLSDWLGTAMTNAQCAASELEAMRNYGGTSCNAVQPSASRAALVVLWLKQALEDAEVIKTALENR